MSIDTFNPYVGLRAFNSDESILFFGRTEQTVELLERLHRHHFVTVVGTSGCGKSSLLRAGLIPSLKAGYLVGSSDRWVIAIMKPGQTPIQNLAESILLQINPQTQPETISALVQKIKEEGADALINIIKPLRDNNNINFFLLVDQFEEIFRFAMKQNDVAKKDEAIDFVSIILELSQQKLAPMYVVLTMRSDFIGDCTSFTGLPEAMNKSLYLVPKINRVQLKTVIEGPAKLYGKQINSLLTSHLLNELSKLKDELPLLQHTLMRMWDQDLHNNRKGELDLSDYVKIGGIEKALSNHADEAIEKLHDNDLLLTKKIFQALTAVDENGRKIRRKVLIGELAAITGASAKDLLRVIRRFVDENRSFLVVIEAKKIDDYLIDITHESLIRQWGTLDKWVDEEEESASNYLRLVRAATENKFYKKDYLTGIELQVQLEWYKKNRPIAAWANRHKEGFDEGIEYLKASEDNAVYNKTLKKRSRQREVIGVALITLIIVSAIIARSVFTTNALKKAVVFHIKAEDKVNIDQTMALKLEAAALEQLDKTNTDLPAIEHAALKLYAENSFYKIVQKFDDSVLKLVQSPDGKNTLVCTQGNIAYLLNSKDELISTYEDWGEVYTASFSPDGKTILVSSTERGVQLYDLNEKLIHHYNKPQDSITCALFSPDGQLILTASKTRVQMSVWKLNGEKQTVLKRNSNNYSVISTASFSSDGNSIFALWSDNTVQSWNIVKYAPIVTVENAFQLSLDHSKGAYRQQLNEETIAEFSPDKKLVIKNFGSEALALYSLSGQKEQYFTGYSGEITCAKFSPDGQMILTSSTDNNAYLWDLQGNIIQKFMGHADEVNTVTFSLNGQSILTGSSDSTLRSWALTSIATKNLKGHTGDIRSVDFSKDGKFVLTGSSDGTADMWDLNGVNTTKFKSQGDSVISAAISPDGKLIATGGVGKLVRIWNSDGHLLYTFPGHSARINSVAFSPDGKTILTGSRDRTARLWDLDGNVIQKFEGHGEALVTASFSPDGKTILTASLDSTARLWDLQGQTLKIFKDSSEQIFNATFSPNGNQIITITGNTAKLRDLEGNTLQKFEFPDWTTCIAFSPDGQRILTGTYNNKVLLWDLKGNILQKSIGNTGTIFAVAFSPDGKTIATAADNIARIFKIKPSLKEFLKSGGVPPLSAEQKQQYLSDEH